jgi:hypothetical protein
MMVTEGFSIGEELVLQQPLQTEREPDIEYEIQCPRCYDIMVLSYDFDRLYYFVKNAIFHS